MSPSTSTVAASCCSSPTGSRHHSVLLLAVAVATVVLTTRASASDSPLDVVSAAVDRASAASSQHHPGGIVGDQLASVSDQHRLLENDDELASRRYEAVAELLAENADDVDDASSIDKRRSKMAAFRSDLGRKRSAGDDDGLDADDDDDEFGFDAAKRSSYRMRGGKAFKADLGKRARAAAMFRSDLGRRSVGEDGIVDGLLLADGGATSALVDDDGGHLVDRRRSMFRSDLGKRAVRPESVRRMFRADLGKRRVQFRHDLG